MKSKTLALFVLFCAVTVMAQTNSVPGLAGVPTELLGKPLKDWQINLTTIALGVMLLGRVITALKGGGGLKGMVMAVWGGTNAPTTKQP